MDHTELSELTGSHTWWLAVVITLLIAAVVGFSGTSTLPIDAHESYVIETTREMIDRGELLVPYFNNTPRLKKPPLNYWLTAATAFMAGSTDRVLPWHGRLPSIMAGLGMVILTLLVGTRLYNRKVALLAALILSTSAGFFSYTHDARPEMFYSFCCTAGFTAFVFAVARVNNNRPSVLPSYAMWISYAMATLTKGPHLPLMFLIASLIFSRIRSLSWRKIWGLFRPLEGMIIFLLLTVPWWYALQQQLGGKGLSGSQLSGTLLTIHWSQILNPYYLYRPLQLLLPWLALLPFAIILFRRGQEQNKARFLLLLFVLVPALGLNLGPQFAWYYMLPSLVPLCILFAAGTVRIVGDSAPKQVARWTFRLFAVHFLLLLALILWAPFATAGSPSPVGYRTLFVLIVEGGVFAGAFFLYTRRHLNLIPCMIATAILFGVMFSTLGSTSLYWSEKRFYNITLSRLANEKADISTPLVTWNVNPAEYVYYTRRFIPQLRTETEIEEALAASPSGKMVLFLLLQDQGRLPKGIKVERLDSLPPHRKACILVLLQRSPS